MDDFSLDDLPELPEPRPAPGGFPFPLPILLVQLGLYDTDTESQVEGTLLQAIEAFDTEAIIGRRYETAIIGWSTYALLNDSPLLDDTRRRLIDWVNLNVMPRVRAGRLPIWL